MISKVSQERDEQWAVILDQDRFTGPTIPLGIYLGVPPTTCVFIPLKIFGRDLQNSSL